MTLVNIARRSRQSEVKKTKLLSKPESAVSQVHVADMAKHAHVSAVLTRTPASLSSH